MIFCPTVKTGAFVARRNGKVFVTGNSGFPKSLDVSKAIDKMAGAEREVVGFDEKKAHQQTRATGTAAYGDYTGNMGHITAPATEAAKQWDGWGTALKPAVEPIVLARKPLIGTVAQNVLEHGTGGLNIDGCRVAANGDKLNGGRVSTDTEGWDRPWKHDEEAVAACHKRGEEAVAKAESLGRFPANLIHDGSDEVVELFPVTTSGTISPHHIRNTDGGNGNTHGKMIGILGQSFGDSGSAARFFYAAKCSKKDRNEGCESITASNNMRVDAPRQSEEEKTATKQNNFHPTVKPTDLMQYLCRLITPPYGVVLDPFMGSGSTGKAAMRESFRFIGIERDESYFKIAEARITAAREAALAKLAQEVDEL